MRTPHHWGLLIPEERTWRRRLHQWHGWYRERRDGGLKRRSPPKNHGHQSLCVLSTGHQGTAPGWDGRKELRARVAVGQQWQGALCDCTMCGWGDLSFSHATPCLGPWTHCAWTWLRTTSWGLWQTVPNIQEKWDCERHHLHTEGWDAEVSPMSPQVKWVWPIFIHSHKVFFEV